MKTIGFLISHKDGERRRALLPKDIKKNVNFPEQLFFEVGYANSVGVADEDYIAVGCNIVSRKEVMECDVICDVKLGDADYLDELSKNKILFGWGHTVQNVDFTSEILMNGHTVIAWEEIFEDGRYIFYRNREIAGEAAIMQAFQYSGKMPYDTRVAIIGNGQTAKGAMRVLHGLGAHVDVFGRKLEALFKEKMYEYDVLVNCVMWDTSRKDRLIYKEDLKKMKTGTLIIDVSCDPNLEIETSHPTKISDPVYVVDGIIHYTVDNTPAMYPITVTNVLSDGVSNYIDIILNNDLEDFPKALKESIVIKDGHIVDERIRSFRNTRGLFCR